MNNAFMYALCMILSFASGWFWHIIYTSKRRDGTLVVRKSSENEIVTLFKLEIEPERLLTNEFFVLRIERD